MRFVTGKLTNVITRSQKFQEVSISDNLVHIFVHLITRKLNTRKLNTRKLNTENSSQENSTHENSTQKSQHILSLQ